MNDIENNSRWYAVQCIARRERFAEQNLLKQLYTTFFPFFWKSVRHARKTRTVQQALFPGYLFIQMDLLKDRWRAVNGTFGVSRIVMNRDSPVALPRGVIEDLMQHLDTKGAVNLDHTLKIGQKVKVISGPMANIIGELISLDDNGRVRVLMEIMSGKIVVTLDSKILHPAESNGSS
jgi:transcription elongation factor/antiterminator RfaH